MIEPVVSGWVIFGYFILVNIVVIILGIALCCFVRWCCMKKREKLFEELDVENWQDDWKEKGLIDQGEAIFSELPQKAKKFNLVEASS